MTKSSSIHSSIKGVKAALLIGLLSHLPPPVLASESPIARLRYTTWGSREGTPPSAIGLGSFGQTTDGYLWYGTQDGLYRFDGTRFVRYILPDDSRSVPTSVWAILPARHGGLWIGFTFGGIGFLAEDRFTFYQSGSNFPAGSVKALSEDSAGDVWAATSRGLARFSNGNWQVVTSGAKYPGSRSDETICGMIVDSDDNVWIGGGGTVYVMLHGTTIFERGSAKFSQCVYFAESPRGSLWASDGTNLQKLHESKHPSEHNVSSSNILIDRAGSLWATEPGSLMRLSDSDSHPVGETVAIGSIGDRVGVTKSTNTSVREDTEGNIWTLNDEGVGRFSPSNVIHEMGRGLDARIQLGMYSPILVIGEGQKVFASRMMKDWKEGFTYVDGRIAALPEIRDPSAAYRLRNGNVMIGGLVGLAVYEHDRVSMISLPDAASGNEVQSIAQDSDGALWISVTRTGVFKRDGSTWVLNAGIKNLPSEPAVILADTTTSNEIWLGYTSNRISSVDQGVASNYGVDEGISLGVVRAIYAKRKDVWVGGDRGVARLSGNRFVDLQSRSAHALDGATGIIETASGDLWINCVSGVIRVDAAELSHAARDASYPVNIESFSESDGIHGSSTRVRPLPTAVEGNDGRLWFSTNINIYSIDPTHLHRNLSPPLMHIQRIVADEKEYKADGHVLLPIHTSLLRIDYAGLDFTTPEKVQYRYKLDGIDSDWRDAGDRVQAFYTNLPPRQYVFHVMAANGSGIWSKPIDADFEILPSFFQTQWFKLLCVLGVVILVYLLFQLRLRQVAARLQQRLEARNSERERIARDLHDTILQSAEGLILHVHSAIDGIPATDPIRVRLESSLDQASALTTEGRELVQSLRTFSPTELAQALKQVAEEAIATGSKVACNVRALGEVRGLKPEAWDELFRIAREAIGNACRHSGASELGVEVDYAAKGVSVRIQDNGCGIPEATLESGASPGHWGLQGMHERAREVGAQIKITTQPQEGTSVVVFLGARLAYEKR